MKTKNCRMFVLVSVVLLVCLAYFIEGYLLVSEFMKEITYLQDEMDMLFRRDTDVAYSFFFIRKGLIEGAVVSVDGVDMYELYSQHYRDNEQRINEIKKLSGTI